MPSRRPFTPSPAFAQASAAPPTPHGADEAQLDTSCCAERLAAFSAALRAGGAGAPRDAAAALRASASALREQLGHVGVLPPDVRALVEAAQADLAAVLR